MDFNLYQYKDIFGKINTGVHSYRILNVAVVDFFGTIIIAYGIAKFFNYELYQVLIIAFILGIILHRIFHVKTTVDKILFQE